MRLHHSEKLTRWSGFRLTFLNEWIHALESSSSTAAKPTCIRSQPSITILLSLPIVRR